MKSSFQLTLFLALEYLEYGQNQSLCSFKAPEVQQGNLFLPQLMSSSFVFIIKPALN